MRKWRGLGSQCWSCTSHSSRSHSTVLVSCLLLRRRDDDVHAVRGHAIDRNEGRLRVRENHEVGRTLALSDPCARAPFELCATQGLAIEQLPRVAQRVLIVLLLLVLDALQLSV